MIICICSCNVMKKKSVKKHEKKQKKKKCFNKYKEHTGVCIGHKNCKGKTKLIPANKGFLWKRDKSKKEWKPGTISKQVTENMKKTNEEIMQKMNEERVRSVNTVKKSLCLFNTKKDQKENTKSLIDVDCAESDFKIIINPPKNVPGKNFSSSNLNSELNNDKIILNIKKKQFNQFTKLQKNDNAKNLIEEDHWDIQCTPPLAWLKNGRKTKKNASTQYIYKECMYNGRKDSHNSVVKNGKNSNGKKPSFILKTSMINQPMLEKNKNYIKSNIESISTSKTSIKTISAM